MPKQKYKQRKDGRFRTSFRGKSIYANSSKELQEKITELNYLYNNGAAIDLKNATFKEYAENWFDLEKKIHPQKDHSRVTRLLNKHIYPKIGLIKLKAIKKSTILDLQASLIEKNLTDTMNRCITLVKKILDSAVDDNIILKNVASNIKGIHFPKTERRPLTREEDFLLLETAKTHKHGLFFLFMRYCGLRPEEARALTIDDINIDEQYADIYEAWSFTRNIQGELKDTKNTVHRQVPILDFMMPLVIKRIEECKKNNTKILFPKQKNPNEYMSKIAYKRCVQSFLFAVNELNKKLHKNDKEKKNQKISFIPYQLRHSYCTMLYYAGIGLKEAQELMRR